MIEVTSSIVCPPAHYFKFKYREDTQAEKWHLNCIVVRMQCILAIYLQYTCNAYGPGLS